MKEERERMSNGWEDEGESSQAALFVALFASSGQGGTKQVDGEEEENGEGAAFHVPHVSKEAGLGKE